MEEFAISQAINLVLLIAANKKWQVRFRKALIKVRDVLVSLNLDQVKG